MPGMLFEKRGTSETEEGGEEETQSRRAKGQVQTEFVK